MASTREKSLRKISRGEAPCAKSKMLIDYFTGQLKGTLPTQATIPDK